MRLRLALLLALPIVLASCGVPSQDIAPEDGLEAMAITSVAWGERVLIQDPDIPPLTTAAVAVLVNGVSTLTVHQEDNRVVFDLPEAPFPYAALPTDSDDYAKRGNVLVQVMRGSSELARRTYQPFGGVVSGELSVLVKFPGAPESCRGFYSWLHNRPLFDLIDPPPPVSGELKAYATNLWCYATVSFTKLGTANAITSLRNQILARYDSLTAADITISRNVVFGSDGENSYDPSCEQIAKWLDPYASNFKVLNASQIKGSVNAGVAHQANIRGNGVTVVLIGGGVNLPSLTRPGQVLSGINLIASGAPQDDFKCNLDGVGPDDFLGHDTWVAEIINTVAPRATIDPVKVCDEEGNCPSSKVTQALLYVINTYVSIPTPRRVILHMSLGGPLENATQEAILTFDNANAARLLLVASAGNGGPAVEEHYPASYAEGLTGGTGVLENVLSIGAMGKNLSNAWLEADFTVDGNYNLLAAGVDLCPKSTTFRCNATTPGGFNGTSFSAPIATGVAALYVQDLSTPTPPVQLDALDIRACMVANTAPTTQPLSFPANSVWYNPAAVCP
jgi:hypothetical protein